MSWENDPVFAPAAAPVPSTRAPWENDPIAFRAIGPRAANGVADAFVAGWQNSATGYIARGKLPDVVLDAQHSTWYEKLVAAGAQLAADTPEMIAGAIGGGAAGGAVGSAVPVIGNVAGAAVGAGAGAFALPTAIRESYIQALSRGEIQSSADFLDRASIVLKHTGKDALIGGLTGGAGRLAEVGVAPLLGEKVLAGGMTAGAARTGTEAAKLGAEYGTLVVAPAALEGRMPEPQDFLNTAILLLGLKGASMGAARLQEIYARTGKTPMEVAADAKRDPTIVEDLQKPEVQAAPPVENTATAPAEDVRPRIAELNGQMESLRADIIQGSQDLARLQIVPELPPGTRTTTNKAGEVFIDTRGEGRFHGSSSAIESLSDDYALAGDNRNIYGQGFYTTDAADISNGYMRKGRGGEPTLYKVTEKNNPKLFDMEAPLTPELKKKAEEILGPLYRETDVNGKDIENLRELYDEARAESQAEGYSRDDVQEMFDSFRHYLERKGYDGFTHVGGLKTGNRAHTVNIYWTPEKHVSIEKADIAAYKAPTRDETAINAKVEQVNALSKQLAALSAQKRELEQKLPPADSLAEYGPEIPRAYEPLARETAARDAVPDPSPEAARAFIEKPFAEVPQLPGEPVLPTHVNYNYLNTTAEVQGALSRLSGLYEQRMVEAKRDTVSWEHTYQEARALFEQTTGEKLPEAPTDANYRALAADVYAQKQMLVSGAEQLMQLRNDYVKAREEGRETPEMKLQLVAQIERVAQAQAAARGSQAEVGRALNILRSTNRDKAYYDQLNSVIEGRFAVDGKLGDKNFDKMVDMMGDLGSPREALAFADRAARATTWDKVVEAWKAGLVSGPFTQIANVLGNTTFMATRPFVDTVAAVMSLMRSGPDRVRAVEPLARVVGNIQGVVDGAKMFAAVLRTGESSAKVESRRNAIEGTAGEIVRAPFRLLSAADAFFRVANERGEAYALASREAAAEGFNPATREFRERVAQLATNPTSAMEEAIQAAGQRFTFNTPLGEKGQAVQAVVRKLHLEWAVPFVQTPANIAKEMLRLTPAAPIIGEWRDAIARGGAARDQAVAEMALGTSVGVAVFSLALAGHISGQGDPDPKKRAVQMASGWQPYSIKIGDTWYSYQRLQPVGTLIGMSADMASVWEHMTPEESDKVPKILATAFANAITNQTFLQGITNIVNAISDPGRFGPRFVQGMAASTVPAIAGQTAAMMDPYQREVDSVKDAVVARIPGLRQDLLPKRDPYGEPIPAKDRLGEISPITVSRESDDKVRKEAARLGVGAAKAPESIELPAAHDKKLGQVKLTPEQQDVFASEAGRLAYQVLSQLVNQPTWDNMPDMAQRNAMQMVFEKSRAAGRAAAVSQEQLARESDRIANELRHRMAQEK